MAVGTSRRWDTATQWRPILGIRFRMLRAIRKFFRQYRFSSIARRILVINCIGVAILVTGILYPNQYRAALIGTRVQSLEAQAAIIANALAQLSANTADPADEFGLSFDETKSTRPLASQDLSKLSFRINPEVIAPMLRDLVSPTKTRARIYDSEGNLLLDSHLYRLGQIGRLPAAQDQGFLPFLWRTLKAAFADSDLPPYRDNAEGKDYEELRIALNGGGALPVIRLNEANERVITAAQPIKRQKAVIGALFLSTEGGDIDDLVLTERLQLIAIAIFVVIVTAIMSWLLAGQIAGPMQRLAAAALRVRKNIKTREPIPDYSHRSDEIGELSRALRDMTNALYTRLDAIENFAADVSHELKNPLTSLRSAADTLSFVKQEDDRRKLIEIIGHDVARLNRLITDIADASRLDAELGRETARPVNIALLLSGLCEVMRESRAADGLKIDLRIKDYTGPEHLAKAKDYAVLGHDSRISQVVTNLIANAISFSPARGTIFVSARRIRKTSEIEIAVEDEGPGIRPDYLEKVFARFYTDRPNAFGQNSGLGLNISEQIVKAHKGRIWAENRTSPEPMCVKAERLGRRNKSLEEKVECRYAIGAEEAFACGVMQRMSYGARFVIRLPAISAGGA